MNMEQRLILHRIKLAVKSLVILILKVGRLLRPQRLRLVYDIILVSVNIFAVLPLLLLAEEHRHRHELAIFVQESLDAALLRKLLLLVINEQGNYSSPVRFVASLHLIFR